MIKEVFESVFDYLTHLNSFIIALIIFILVILMINFIDKLVEKNVSAKRQKSNWSISVHTVKYLAIIFLVAFLIGEYASPDTDYSIVIGFISAALGFALQKPITGAFAWIVIVMKKPFYIGDRIIVGDVKGVVEDITLSHIVLEEIGGTVSSEERSGRIIHVPTTIFFEEDIVNYTLEDEYILDELTVMITYESNLEKAEFIMQKAANEVLKVLDKSVKQAPYVRLFFDASGINLKLRYFVPAGRRQEISSDIIRTIHRRFNKEKDVTIAYPHMQLVYNPDEIPTKRPSPKKSQSTNINKNSLTKPKKTDKKFS